jgi:hypothetical protein
MELEVNAFRNRSGIALDRASISCGTTNDHLNRKEPLNVTVKDLKEFWNSMGRAWLRSSAEGDTSRR